MIRQETSRWIRACLAIPCLAATLCLTQVGCGGGTDDSGTDDSSTTTTDDGTDTTTDGTDTTE